ncbi:MAG: helix-turn-helix domain-containing protein [Erythrobacter sp.]|nr:helix-turn-helix domain-containing protein [Erythrobacter sp.]
MVRQQHVWDKFALYGETWSDLAPEFVHIEPVSARSALHDWNIAAHSHPAMHQVLLLQQGAGKLTVDGREMPLAAPMLVAVPSLCVHAFAFAPDSEGWVVSFAVDLLHDPRMAAAGELALFRQPQALLAPLAERSGELARIGWLLADFAARKGDGQGDGQQEGQGGRLAALDAAQLALLLACVDAALAQGVAGTGGGGQQRLAERFRALVDENFRRGWSMADYARQLATTEPTLTRACRASFGKAPGMVVQERLAIEAMRYLSFSGASVKEIAGRLGFSDPAYFARFFRRMTGQTASQFRHDARAASEG